MPSAKGHNYSTEFRITCSCRCLLGALHRSADTSMMDQPQHMPSSLLSLLLPCAAPGVAAAAAGCCPCRAWCALRLLLLQLMLLVLLVLQARTAVNASAASSSNCTTSNKGCALNC